MKVFPDENGYFGEFGGVFVDERARPAIDSLIKTWNEIKKSQEFWDKVSYYNKYYTGRPSSLYYAERLTKYLGGAKIYLKREDLNHTGAHKINHCIGQILLAKKWGRKK